MSELWKIPEQWIWDDMKNVVKWSSGGTPKATELSYYENGTIPWLITADLNEDVVYLCEKNITQAGYDSSSAKMVEIGAVFVAMYGSIGKLGIAGIECCTNQAIAFSKELKCNNKYLFYYLRAIKSHLLSLGKGGTQQNISLTVLNSLSIPLPPTIKEQQQIVERLEARLEKLSIARQRLAKIPRILKRFRQSVLASACSGKLTAGWREGKDLQEWEETTLRELCSKFQYGTSQKSNTEGLVPVLRMGNIQNGKIDWNDLAYTSDEEDIKKYALTKGDVLFNRTNSAEHVGKTAIFESDELAIFAGYLIKIHNDKAKLDSWYLNYSLNTLRSKAYCQLVKSDGVNQSNINAQKLADFIITLPPLPEQEEIVRRVDKLFAIADSIEQRYRDVAAKLAKVEKALYAKAFKGEL